MSRASVESTLFRARRRLGEEYEELVSGERCRRVQELVDIAVEATVPGLRDQRRLSAHLSHCQPCRRHARGAGLDDAFFAAPRGVRAKVAAFFPLPAFLQRRWGAEAAPAPSSTVSTLAQASAQLGSSIDPAMASWLKAAAAAATIAVAGTAGGAAVSDTSRELPGGATPAKRDASLPPRDASPASVPAPTPGQKAGSVGASAAPASGTDPSRRSSRRAAGTAEGVAGTPSAKSGRGSQAGPSGAPALPDIAPDKVIGALPPTPAVNAPAVSAPVRPDPASAGTGVKTAGEKATSDAEAAAKRAAEGAAAGKGQAEGAAGAGTAAVDDAAGQGKAAAEGVAGQVPSGTAGTSVLGG